MSEALTIQQYIRSDAVQEAVRKSLNDKAPQFIASLSSLIAQNKNLALCEPKSILAACMTAASLDLPFNQSLGFAHIIPYKGVAQFQMGWRGFVQLAQRSGLYSTINVTDVREGEIAGINRLTGELNYTWCDDEKERALLPIVGYTAYFRLNNNFEKSLYMTVDELKSHAKQYSQAYKSNSSVMNPWRDNFDSMAKKTVIKLLLGRFGPMTVDMQQAQVADQAVISDDGERYIDNEPVSASDIAYEKEKARIVKHIAEATNIDELAAVSELVGNYGLGDEYSAKLSEFNGKLEAKKDEVVSADDLKEKIANSKFAPKKVEDVAEEVFNG